MDLFGRRPHSPSGAPSPGRRRFLRSGVELGATLWLASALPGCSGRPDQAYEPWTFPSSDGSTELGLVHAALLAASPHNTQPWWFRVAPGSVELFHDEARSLGAMDGLGREAFIGLGCAIENAWIAAAHVGAAAALAVLPEGVGSGPVARIGVGAATGAATGAGGARALYDAIAVRHTNRGP
ncbi:hypothetical protein L6R52_42670, partial [Myxococcota bacterium]|nr:hypothetical protein [Myxococcota bacterium]